MEKSNRNAAVFVNNQYSHRASNPEIFYEADLPIEEHYRSPVETYFSSHISKRSGLHTGIGNKGFWIMVELEPPEEHLKEAIETILKTWSYNEPIKKNKAHPRPKKGLSELTFSGAWNMSTSELSTWRNLIGEGHHENSGHNDSFQDSA